MSSCGMVPCLSAYSVIVTTILVIISIMYSNTGTTIIRKCDNIGTQEVQGQTHVDMNNSLEKKVNANAILWSG